MPRTLNLTWKGLYTYQNQFSQVPEGAMAIADNVVIDREGIVSSRRGFAQYGIGTGSTYINTINSYQDKLILHLGNNTIVYDSDDAGTWVAYSGTYNVPDPTDESSRIRFAGANKNLYFVTEEGIEKLDSVTGTIRTAGAPNGLGGTGTTTGASGFMSNNVNVAYRVVWGYRDANNNLILGAPSDRIIVTNNSGGTRNVSLTFQVPAGITTDWFYQVYRSGESASLADEPNDEMQQVYEDNPTAGQISSSSVTITDTTPNDLRQATLYTSPSQEGIENANWEPPFAKDIATFKGYMFYANTRSPHRFFLTLIAVGGTDGLQVGDTITFTRSGGSPTFTLTAAVAENAALGEFQVHTGGTPAENIEDTARSMINIMNAYASNTLVNGYYTSGFADLPGQLLFEEHSLTTSSFSVISSRTTCWQPRIPTSGTTTTNVSTNEVSPNRVYISKFQQPEAVPLLNYLDIGSADEPIIRILALRDGLFILKTDGVWRISGETLGSFRVALLDGTVKILAANSAVTLANQVFFFSEQGIVAASDSGVAVVSRAIEGDLLELSSDLFPNFDDLTFAVSYESDRKYILGTITTSADTAATQLFVYNTFTNTWTRWVRTFTTGYVNPEDNKLYFGTEDVSDAVLRQERKDFALTDYADESYSVTITSASGMVINLVDTSEIEVGMTLEQSGFRAIVEEVTSSTVIVVDRDLAFVAGPASVFRPIEISVRTIQLDAKEPTFLKHYRDFSMLFSDAAFEQLIVRFRSDFIPDPIEVVVEPNDVGGWGEFQWGLLPWGGGQSIQQRIRTLVPQSTQRANWLIIEMELEQAFTTFSLNGAGLVYEMMDTRMR